MKTRFDFVSNSSSSSFICLEKDARQLKTRGHVKKISFGEYCEDYIWREIFDREGYEHGFTKLKVGYLDDADFRRRFAEDEVWNVLPKSTKDDFEELRESIRIARRKGDWDVVAKYRARIENRIYDVLKPEFGDETFVVVDADDHGPLPTEEDFMKVQFDGLNGFKRIFDEHY